MIDLPDEMRRTAESRGDDGRAWLASLPERLARLRRTWGLTIGPPMPGGKAAFVARVRRSDGSAAVLKIVPDGDDTAAQVRAMRVARGRGCAIVLDHDRALGAVLLEPLGHMLAEAGLTSDERVDVLTRTLVRIWTPPPADAVVPPGEDKASDLRDLITTLWSDLGGPCSRRLRDLAIATAERRTAAFDRGRAVLCHGDPHANNALAVLRPRPGAETGYVFVDPDPLVAEPEYDLGVVLRDEPREVLAADDPRRLLRRRAERAADATGLDADAVEEWAFVERVSTGLYLLRHGHVGEGREFLASAERLKSYMD